MFVILSMNLHIHQQRRLSKVNPTGYQEARGPGIVLASCTLTCHCGQYTTCFSGLGRNGNQAQWLQQFSEKSSEEVTPCWARYWGPRMTVQRGQKQLEAPGESQTPQDGLKAGKRLRKSDGAWESKSRQACVQYSGVWVGGAQIQNAISSDFIQRSKLGYSWISILGDELMALPSIWHGMSHVPSWQD